MTNAATGVTNNPAAWALAMGGLLLLIMCGLVIGHSIMGWSWALPVAGGCGWLTTALLWRWMGKAQRRGCLILATMALACLLGLWSFDQPLPGVTDLLTSNVALGAFLASLTFLRLLLPDHNPMAYRPRGRRALWSTLISLHLLSGIISMTAALLYAHGMASHGRLGKRRALVVERGLCNAAFWSPFRANMATVLLFVPGVAPAQLMTVGASLALVALLLTLYELRPSNTALHAAPFVGYRLSWQTLQLPVVVVLLVLVSHWLWPELQTLVITSTVIFAVVLGQALRGGKDNGWWPLWQHIRQKLPMAINEIGLFMMIGFLTLSLSQVMTAADIQLPLQQFGALAAIMVLLICVLLASLGLHPLIMISLFSYWLMPLNPDPLLLALTFLSSWVISSQFNPISAPHLILHSQLQVNPMGFLRWNYPFVGRMLLVVAVSLVLVDYRHSLWQLL